MRGAKILIVDDDLDLLLGLRIRLKANGYDVVAATDGYAAVSTTRNEMPDLIILDLGLPAGDGFEVIERLKALIPFAHVPIIVLSGRDPALNAERALRAGAQAFFQKPADNETLLAAIQRALAASVSSQEASGAGDAEAMQYLGFLYDTGHGVTQNRAASALWYKKAASAGDAQAMTNLGVLYENGWGVAQDYRQARQWYEQAAAAGNAQAMTNLGVLFEHGKGMTKDRAAALTLYRKAAAGGDENAKKRLQELGA